MPLDLNDAFNRAHNESPFSNGTEYYAWHENWCGSCRREQPFLNGISGQGCPLLLVALSRKTPAEWLDGPRDERGLYSLGDQYHCVEFRGLGGGGSGEPRPKPEPTGMDGLFVRPERATRMYVQPAEAPVVIHEGAAR